MRRPVGRGAGAGRRSREEEQDSRRRGAMLWMLREAGGGYRGIALAIGLSSQRVREICLWYGEILDLRSRDAAGTEPFMGRLRSAGAIPRDRCGAPAAHVFGPRRTPREGRGRRRA